VNRTDAKDVQSESSQQGMKDHENLKEGSSGISRKDENNSTERAKKEHPEAPDTVIGMQDERGGVSCTQLCYHAPTNNIRRKEWHREMHRHIP